MTNDIDAGRQPPARSAAERDELMRTINEITWYHSIDLRDGVVTPGKGNLTDVPRLRIPERLDGKTVLDVGAWDGFWSFEAESRGADRVLATDSFVWTEGGSWGKQGFELARRALGSRVEDREIDVMDLSPETVGTWDLVLFLGVLYHVRDPITAIERVASVTADHLILDTVAGLDSCRHPAALCFPGGELSDDDTNWWALNDSAIVALLRRFGFRSVERYAKSSYRSRLRSAARQLYPLRRGGKAGTALRSSRVLYHAWKSR